MTTTEFFAPEQQFLSDFLQSVQNHTLNRLILSQYKGEIEGLEKITFKLIQLKNTNFINVLYKYKTQDITKNIALDAIESEVKKILADCKQANLFTQQQEIQLKKNKKKAMRTVTEIKENLNLNQEHNREKKRYIDQESAFLCHLGITDHQHQLVPSMSRKWKQINKFIEILSGALQLVQQDQQNVHIVDFGSGKGYLTFALYDYMQKQFAKPWVTGVELNPKMVQFCQNVAQDVGFDQLQFFQGDVRTYQPQRLDVMIALHACDIATDFAIHTGIRLNAQIIMCAPCCHKELRPQLQSPTVLKPMLQFGIHAGQQAEMLTDTIRALLLKAYGYETKVFEFVALEHTSKNKMILATKKSDFQQPDQEVLAQIEALKQMYGISQHSLQLLLNNEWQQQNIGCKC